MSNNSIFYDNYYKPFFAYVQQYIPKWITPNAITISSWILINILTICELYYYPWIFSAFLFIYWSLDNLDGIHARATKQTSSIGEILDHCIDSYNIIIISNIFCNLLNTQPNIYKILMVFITLAFNIRHLAHKYTNILSLGYKYFSVDEVWLIAMFIPHFIPQFISLILSNNILCYITYFICIVCFIDIIYNMQKIITKIKFYDLIFYLTIGILNYFMTNVYLIATMNMCYIFYLINSRYKDNIH
jgi:phosphatidylglycerophosphate synthase